jgi:hypothetical protein
LESKENWTLAPGGRGIGVERSKSGAYMTGHGVCYDFGPKCPPKAHVLKAWTSGDYAIRWKL